MFCAKCGRRMKGRAVKCTFCGALLPESEYCNGFWLELNQNSQQTSRMQDHVKTDGERISNEEQIIGHEKSAATKSYRETAAKRPMLQNIAVIEGAIVLALIVFILSSQALHKKAVNALEERVYESEQRVGALEKQNSDLSDLNNDLNRRIKQLVTGKWEQQKEKEELEQETVLPQENHNEKNEKDGATDSTYEKDSDLYDQLPDYYNPIQDIMEDYPDSVF